MLTLSTPYQWKDRNIEDFDECSQVRSTIEKNGRREKYFKTKRVLVPKLAVLRKEEGAAVDSSAILPYLSLAGSFVRAGRAAFSIEESKSVGNSH